MAGWLARWVRAWPARPTAPNPKAREFTAQWQAPGDTGGTALMGYHVIMRPNGAAWPPDSQAKKVGATTRSQRFSKLTPNRIYWFRVKACNGAQHSRCSGWSPQASVTLPIGRPDEPTWGSFTEESTQIRVTWRAPDDTGGVGLTGYGLRHWRKGASEPSSAQVVVNAQTSERTFGGLTPDTAYRFSIQACNGTDRCSGWTNKDGKTPPTPTPPPEPPPPEATKPGRVGQPTVDARDAALYVDWTAPGDGGAAISHHDIRYRAGTSGPWTETRVPPTATETVPTDMTVSSLSNGTAYQVQVRACNTHGCGAWSTIQTGTPRATVTDPVSRPTTHDSLEPPDECGEAVTSTALAKPANLDIVPLADRRAVLVWNGTTATDNFIVEVKATGTSTWRRPNLSDPSTNTITKPCYTIHLDDITTDPDESTKGLGDAIAFDFRVTANKGTDSLTSDSITIIDTPIAAANGHSSGTTGQALLAWSNMEDVLPLTRGSKNGKYLFRIRKFASGHANRTWSLDIDTSTPFKSFIPSDSNRNLVTSLTLGEVYAIQYRWNGLVAGAVMRVRAARDAYVWPSTSAPEDRDLIATYPINDAVEPDSQGSLVLEYRVCEDSFPTDTWEQWNKLIPHAFGQWEAVGNQWGSAANLVALDRESEACVVYGDDDDDDYDTFIERVSADVTKALRPYLDAEGVPVNIPQSVQDSIQSHVEAIVKDGYGKRHEQDVLVNEVILFDDIQLNIDGLIAAGVFPQMAPYVGHFWCWGTAKDGSDFTYNETLACVVRSRNSDGKVISSDLFLRHSKVAIPGTLLVPGADVVVNKNDVSFNTCPAGGSDAYAVLVHEAGHMLGIRGPLTGPKDEVDHKHPTIQGASMMVASLEPRVGCSPHPFDVMVLHAIYQSQ